MGYFPYKQNMPWGIQVLGSGEPEPPAWSPTDLGAELEAWYSNAFLVTVGDGNPIAQWDDASGNDAHAAQGTGASQPIAVLEGELYHAQGDSVDDYLVTPDFGLAVPYTIWIVFRQNDTEGTTRFISHPTAAQTRFGRQSNEWQVNSSTSMTNVAADEDIWHHIVIRFDTASTTAHLDGASTDAISISSGAAVINLFGASGAGTPGYVNGGIRDFGLVSRALTDEERGDLTTYLDGLLS